MSEQDPTRRDVIEDGIMVLAGVGMLAGGGWLIADGTGYSSRSENEAASARSTQAQATSETRRGQRAMGRRDFLRARSLQDQSSADSQRATNTALPGVEVAAVGTFVGSYGLIELNRAGKLEGVKRRVNKVWQAARTVFPNPQVRR